MYNIQMLKILVGILALFLVSSAGLVQAQDYSSKYPELADMDLEALEMEYGSVKLLRDLRSSKTAIDSMAACGKHVQEAKSTRQSLLDLNARFKNNPTEAYRRDANKLKHDNKQAITNYRSCFSGSLANYTYLVEKGVTSYEIHRTRSGIMTETFSDVTDPSDYLMAIEQEMEDRMAEETSAGRVTSMSGIVHILRGGTGANWRLVSIGMLVTVGDIIRTTSGSRVGMVFESPAKSGGKVELYLAGNTDTEITHYTVSPTSRGALDAGIDLIRGAIRAITREVTGIGPNPMFSVRGGSQVLGVRGTEVIVNYNPADDIAKFTLNHGDAYLQAGQSQTRMQPLTTIKVKNGVASAPQTITKFDWNRLAEETQPSNPPPVNTPRSLPSIQNDNAAVASTNIVPIDNPYTNATFAAERFLQAMTLGNSSPGLVATTTGQLKRQLSKDLKKETVQTVTGRAKKATMLFSVRCIICDRQAGVCDVLAELSVIKKSKSKDSALLLTTWGDTYTGPQKVGRAVMINNRKHKAFMAQGPQCKY